MIRLTENRQREATHFEREGATSTATPEAAHPTHSMHKAGWGYLHPRGEDRSNQPKSLFNSNFLLFFKSPDLLNCLLYQ